MDTLTSGLLDSLFWLLRQLSAGRLPKAVLVIVVLATATGIVLAVGQVLQQPAAESASALFAWGFYLCLGTLGGFLAGVGLIWMITWALTPVWSIAGQFKCPEVDSGTSLYRVDLLFSNVGFGTANNLAIHFEPDNGHQLVDAIGLGDPATKAAINTAETHLVQLYWQRDKPLAGTLTLTTLRKSGFGSEDTFSIRTYLDKHDSRLGWCEVKPRP